MTKFGKFIRLAVIAYLVVSVVDLVVRVADIGAKAYVFNPMPVPFGVMPDMNDVQYNSVVRLVMGNASCSGWVVDKHYLVTAAHCLNDYGHVYTKPIKIYSDTAKLITDKAIVQGYHSSLGMGLVYGDFSKVNPLLTDFKGEEFSPGNGSAYVACGFPAGQKESICTPFSAQGTLDFNVVGISHFVPGMSGGPVIDVGTMTAVGIITGTLNQMCIVSPIEGFWGVFHGKE